MSYETPEQLREYLERGDVQVRKYDYGDGSKPLVSVVVVHHYQNAEWWAQCMGSVEKQRHVKSWEFIEVWAPGKEPSIGACKNMGVAAASADFILFLDDDDWLHPDACSNLLRVQKKSDADVVRCLIMEVAADGSKHAPSQDNTVHMGLIRRSMFVAAKGFEKTSLEEDLELDGRMRQLGAKVIGIRTPLYFYRLHRGQASTANKTGWYERVEKDGFTLDSENAQ